MSVSSPIEARQGLIAVLFSLPLAAALAGLTVLMAGAVV